MTEAEMQSTTSFKKSTDTIYEIKAPLASFDTIDLEDEDQDYFSDVKEPSTPEKGQKETSESSESSSPLETSEKSLVKEADTPTQDPETPTPSETQQDFIASFTSPTVVDNCKAVDTCIESRDANSSENNASAEEIQSQLKIKGRKYREKASNVKYEQIENTSDISDQEKTESVSPLPTLKLKAIHKGYDSDSDSTDSENGYIRSGYISATKGTTGRHGDYIDGGTGVHPAGRGRDSNDSDSTPYSSPKVTRPVIPPPLSKEDSSKLSKRKAYEKRLQRLQVTTKPIERPRSTTPINIHGLEEYASISSPERSPGGSNLQKLKIKLPREDSIKGRSPRRSAKSSSECKESPVFSFHEDLLFTHTRSAILVEDGLPGQSPKRVLVPPTLSPKLSPANSPQVRKISTNSPRYFFTPEVSSSFDENETIDNCNVNKSSADNWAKFDSFPNSTDNNSAADADADSDANVPVENTADTANQDIMIDTNRAKTPQSPVKNHVDKPFDLTKCDELNKEEILTVQIEESGDSCDIKYEVDLK